MKVDKGSSGAGFDQVDIWRKLGKGEIYCSKNS